MKVYRPAFTPEDLQHYHRVVAHSLDVRSHFDVLIWLQGDIQRYLPHEILIAAWGDFDSDHVHHDIISTLTGVRTRDFNDSTVTPLLTGLFKKWTEFGRKPFNYNAGESGFLLADSALQSELGTALLSMRSAMVHGISDERGAHDCLYVTFSVNDTYTDDERGAMTMMLPFIDMALRQVEHLPSQLHGEGAHDHSAAVRLVVAHDLSEREFEILQWVTVGKTNPEIGLILDISEFTVKNHLQRVFKTLNVTNRAQAAGKFQALTANV